MWVSRSGTILMVSSSSPETSFFFFFKFSPFTFLFMYIFIYFWLHWVFIAAHGFYLVAENRVSFLVAVHGLLLAEAFFFLWGTYLGMQASVAAAHGLWCTGLVAPWHVGSSWTRD